MKTLNAILVAVLLSLPQILLGQGSLTPPGAPAPTMKSLDQIEPRTPISALPITIGTAGSYYLTKSLSVSSSDAITVTVDNVGIDLNGFTISSTASPAAGTAILLSGGRKNIRITNGNITGAVTFTPNFPVNNGGTFKGGGFLNGIMGTTTDPIATTVSYVNISGLSGAGIYLGGQTSATLIDACNVYTVGGYGLVATTVSNSTASECGLAAITGNVVANSRGDCVANDIGINATTVSNSFGASTNNIGIQSVIATSCYGVNSWGTSTTTSIGVSAQTATGCQGVSSQYGYGINATNAENCYGSSAGGIGIFTVSAMNCYGTTSGTQGYAFSIGIHAQIAENCYGADTSTTAAAGDGISATTAMCCAGTAPSGANGIQCLHSAFFCDGGGSIGAGTTYFCRPTSNYP